MESKIGIFTSHPIQYQVPFFKYMQESGKIHPVVYFQNNTGVDRPVYDPEFGKEIKWDIPLLAGYESYFLAESPSLYSIFKKNQFDAVIIYGWNSILNFKVIFFAKLFRVKVLLRAESPLNQELLKGNSLKQIFRKLFLKFLFKFIDRFLYIGIENRKFYEYYGVPENKLVFVPYAVDNDRFFAQASELRPNRRASREELGIKDGDFTVLFVGKLIDKKRPMDLLMAYEMLARENKSLIFVGDGNLRESLEKYVLDKKILGVHFVGFKNQTEIGKYYSMADVFILPSGIGETWGLVVNEAMCFGLPVIVSDIVGCGPDLVKDGESGYIYQCGKPTELSDKLKLVADNSEPRAASAQTVRRYGYKEDVEAIWATIR